MQKCNKHFALHAWISVCLFNFFASTTIISEARSSISSIHSVSFHLPITLQQKLSFHNSISTQNSSEWSGQSPSPCVWGETKIRGPARGKTSTGYTVIHQATKRTAGKERENGMYIRIPTYAQRDWFLQKCCEQYVFCLPCEPKRLFCLNVTCKIHVIRHFISTIDNIYTFVCKKFSQSIGGMHIKCIRQLCMIVTHFIEELYSLLCQNVFFWGRGGGNFESRGV